MNASVNAELVKKFFIQASYKQLNANGNEFLTQRDNYGKITYYTCLLYTSDAADE